MAYDPYGWRPYVPVSTRRRQAETEAKRRAKAGQQLSPVHIEGRNIATTFWGKAWCTNLEGYSDYSNRLPRGRTYARNGSVIDLQIQPGKVAALVQGSKLYTVSITITPLKDSAWSALRADCAGSIHSLVELLQGKLSQGVMERICLRSTGLFPSPGEIKLSCSCPDWAGMCKHVAAALYGVGVRLDQRPELLFTLREVDHLELVAEAGRGLATAPVAGGIVLEGEDLGDLFGLDLGEEAPVAVKVKAKAVKRTKKVDPQVAPVDDGTADRVASTLAWVGRLEAAIAAGTAGPEDEKVLASLQRWLGIWG